MIKDLLQILKVLLIELWQAMVTIFVAGYVLTFFGFIALAILGISHPVVAKVLVVVNLVFLATVWVRLKYSLRIFKARFNDKK